jgi:adenylate cyclase
VKNDGTQKRLAAILAADVVGYTRLMEEDSDGTVAAWQVARTEIIDPSIARHNGRIVKHTGDGFLAEFSTVQAAVESAVAMQDGLASSSLEFRMGINLGDIIDDGEDIHGEGVNIAARIEALAEEGGISISGAAYEQVRNRLDCRFEDTGEHEVKHVSAPVRVYRIAAEREEATKIVSPEIPVADKPSIGGCSEFRVTGIV